MEKNRLYLEITFRGPLKRVPVVFFRIEAGNEPLRDWLREMSADDRHLLGQDLQNIQFGWPVGMPVCRPMGDGLHEARTSLSGNRIAAYFSA